jgi:phosphoglycolate phosphatase-like HAD superfamily hydrolase
LDKVETSLSKQALLKRMLVRHAKVPISMVKERAGVVEAAAVEAAAYMPPEYEQLKGYYRPEFKEMELGESQKMLVKLPPADLLKIYQLYFLLRRKGKLDKKEEYLEEEMRRLLEKMKSVGILEAIPTPRTKPPTQVAPDEFKKYLSWVDVMFNKLSQKDVDELANHPDQNILAKVMTGNGTDEEKMVFVEAMDELFDKVMTGEEFDKFIKSSEGALYNKIYSRYRRTVG